MVVGLLGLGKMGCAITQKLTASGVTVIGYAPSLESREQAAAVGGAVKERIADVGAALSPPRVVWLMMPWDRVDDALRDLLPHVTKGDLLVDGGNSKFSETQRRSSELRTRGIEYVDVGVSGGPGGGAGGFSLMVGGSDAAFQRIEPVLRVLASPQGAFGHLGPSGAGHFAKMVHNGVEYGMMESLAEGVDVLAHGPFPDVDLAEVIRVWSRGSVVRSHLTDLLAEVLRSERLEKVRGTAAATGEGQWTVETATAYGVDVPAIAAAVARREESQQRELFAAKIIALLRNRFGGHAVMRE